VSLAAPLTNLVVAPLFALAQPALFLSVVLAPLRPVARLVADGTGLLLVAIDRVAAIGAAIPYSAIDVMPSAATAWLVAGSATALLAACASRHWARPLLVAVAGVGAALWWPVLRPASSSMEVHVIDVGQGDAIAIRTPRARWILIDAGDAWRTGDAGARIVAPYLRRRGGTVALLVLSHPHADHIGGAASVITRVPVATIWDGGFVQSSAVYADVLTAARGRGVEWRRAPSGHTVDVDGVRLTVLAPDSVSLARSRDANEASVVVLAEYHGVRLLFTGDLERAEELELVRQHGESLRAHVLKVGHHGSATSTTPAFLSAVAPRLALVSVGAGNRYGHPDPGVLERLRASGTQVLRTDDDGTIVVSIGGGWMRVGSDEGRWLVRTGRVPGER
jgi:competence protein ComEC